MDCPHRQDNTFWIGGSPCAGKSSVSTLLAERYGLHLYQVDYALRDQMDRIDSVLHPTLATWFAASCDQRWLKPVDELLDNAIGCYQDHFKIIAEDLASLHEINRPDEEFETSAILAEGSALLPESAAQQAASPNRSIWMVPTPAFQLEHYRQRPWVKQMLSECSDARKAFEHWMERDIRFARWVANQAASHDYRVMLVDGSQDIEANVRQVANHFVLKR